MSNVQNIIEQPRDIMHYESDIWAIADLLLAASVKQSDFPTYMMPFFALVMLEGRMLNAIKQVEEEYGFTAEENPEGFKEAFCFMDCGYNEYIVMQGKTLSSITNNDSTFDQDFSEYLKAFDPVLKKLLGIERERNDQKYLNMDGIVAELRGKKILLSIVTAWSKIDLSHYDNSAITTLEEHIKRKWADISASTAGEQYTPDDIISLIAEIVAAKITKPKSQIVHVYDPTCGGANLLFGVADRLVKQAGYNSIATYGSEYNDALYALAAIESRFRNLSSIHYGNTLTTAPFPEKEFDVIVANPPYGTKWSGFEKEIKNDQLGQFPGGLPSVTDGQLLFMQHILWKLDSAGLAVEVHNGSTLFSGGAGEGESNIRKYIFDHDWVEAIIQMPQNEFFNTGIYTYLWIMNKNKSADRKDKVALIDGSNLWKLLKKAKGDKRREMTVEHRKQIVDALVRFTPNSICKIYDREYFYYNRQSLTLTELDDNNQAIAESINLTKIAKIVLDNGIIANPNGIEANDFTIILNKLKAYNYRERPIDIYTDEEKFYRYDIGRKTILYFEDGVSRPLGRGCISFSTSTSKGKKSLKVSIGPEYTTDYEIIPHKFDSSENENVIRGFLDKYVYKPYTLGTNTVGVEVSFTKEFYIPERIDDVEDILKHITELNKHTGVLQSEVTKGLDKNADLKDTGIEWIGMVPKHWDLKRYKNYIILSKGKTPKDFSFEPNGLPYLTMDYLRDREGKMTMYPDEIDGLVAIDDNKLLVLWDGANAGEFIKSKKGYLGSTMAVLDVNGLDMNYLYYFLKSIESTSKHFAAGTTIPHFNSKVLLNFDYPVPPVDEQRGISEYLDSQCQAIDNYIDNLEEQIKAYSQLKQSLISEVITGKRTV